MTYSFRNRFKLHGEHRLDTNDPEIELANSGDDGLVILKPAIRDVTHISDAHELVVQGSGYVDADAAAAVGRKWRQYLTVALARDRIGVDFGVDDRVIPHADMIYQDEPPTILQPLGIAVGDRVIDDDYRLLVFPTQPPPKFIHAQGGTPRISISGWPDRFRQNIDEARGPHSQEWDRQATIAYRLVRLALNDPNPETKHIQLVTAIEVVLKHQDHPEVVLTALEELIVEVDGWSDSALKQRVLEILREDKKEESITRAGSEQVAVMLDGTYNGKSANKFFVDVYGMRSGLVHRERPRKPRPTTDQVRGVAAELQRFVLDLLDAYQAS